MGVPQTTHKTSLFSEYVGREQIRPELLCLQAEFDQMWFFCCQA